MMRAILYEKTKIFSIEMVHACEITANSQYHQSANRYIGDVSHFGGKVFVLVEKFVYHKIKTESENECWKKERTKVCLPLWPFKCTVCAFLSLHHSLYRTHNNALFCTRFESTINFLPDVHAFCAQICYYCCCYCSYLLLLLAVLRLLSLREHRKFAILGANQCTKSTEELSINRLLATKYTFCVGSPRLNNST